MNLKRSFCPVIKSETMFHRWKFPICRKTEHVHTHLPFRAHFSKHRSLADSGWLCLSELNQLSYLHWGLLGSEGITVSPRPTIRLLFSLKHLLGYGLSLKGMNWICSEWCVMQWGWLGRDILCASVLLLVRPPWGKLKTFCAWIFLWSCFVVATLIRMITLTVEAWDMPHCIRSLVQSQM